MKATGILPFLFYVLLTASASYANSRSVVVTDLTTESKTDPIGIDVDVPRLSWKAQHTVRGAVQTAYQIRAALSPADLNRGRDLLWDTDKRESEQSSFIPYEGPTPLSRQRIYWKVRVWYDKDISKWSEPAYFEMGLLNDNDWKAKWIQAGFELGDEPDPCPFFRKPFSTKKAIAKARIYASAKGLYELHLNGMRVGDQYFTPGWTVYDKRIQYQTYDVTDQIIDGDNVLGMVLGNGWIRHFRANNQAEDTQTILAGIVQLEIEYEDGSTEVITTDDTWKSSTGPILSSTIYDGEIFDARLIMHGWDRIEFDDSNWKPVRIHDERIAILEAEQGVPVIKYESLTPDSIFTTPKGELVVDMGQNMVGWIRLQVEGPAGTTVELRHTEVLDSEGNFYTENLRRADQMIQYTLSGDGVEVYEPHFTFQGFRYVKVIGFPGQLQPENITGIVLHSEMERTGDFECSNRLVNQLYHNIIWGQKGNFLDVPTDCPQRDERLGWTGDAQVFAPTACFNMNTIAFYRKWLRDMALDQSDEGIIPWIVPNVMDRVSAACGWADAGTVIPWVVYQYYGDKKVLIDNYEMMKNWVEYIRKTAGDSYL
jgi:alpha-L-rhamnosidase